MRGDRTWSRRMIAACDSTQLTYHEGWAFTVRYTQHLSSLLREVSLVGTFQHVRLEEYD
jgi:polyhydroxyalkanoate synthesis regulator phasin